MTTRTRNGQIRGLYVLIDPAACSVHDPVAVARLALDGGASMLQWRDKLRDKGEQLPDARAVRDLCAERDALFIVNDHADLAVVLGADGLHLGQKDLPIAEARRVVGHSMLIGTSTNNAGEARAAEAAGAAYVAVGAIFPTSSKETTRPADIERLREVRAAVNVPIVAIGGIDASNIRQVVDAGANAAAVISAVCGAADPRAAAAELAGAFR